MGSYLKRPGVEPPTTPGEGIVICGLMDAYPALTEFVTLDRWDDGNERQTGTVLVCFGDGRWRAWLNDRDGSRSAWVSADSLTGLLGALDLGLREGRLEWRGAPPGRRKSGRTS